MKITPITQKTKAVSLLLTAVGLVSGSAHAQTVLGSFQGSGDALNAGWINANSSAPITSDSSSSFVAAGVTGYAQSLDLSAAGHAGTFGYPSLELQFSASQVAAFNANSYLTFTFSVPAATAGGFSQIYNLVLNAPGYGYNNQSWANSQTSGDNGNTSAGGDPNFYFYNGSPVQTMEVTYNYSSVLAAIEAGGESYLQLTLQGNQGGGAPTDFYFNNVILSTSPFGVDAVPEPASMALLDFGCMAGVLVLRRRK
jgi:hypothetical protein